MKVFVFKPSNELIGKFDIDRVDAIAQGLAQFATSRPVKPYDYLECSGKSWTVVNGQDGLELQEGRQSPPKPAETALAGGVSAPTSQLASTLFKRYKDAYTEGHAVVTVGGVIKGIGAFLGIAIIVAGIAMGSSSSGGAVAMIIGIIGGCLVGVPTYVLGILVAAQGQTQLATLDAAVNSSRHLSNDEVGTLLAKKWSL